MFRNANLRPYSDPSKGFLITLELLTCSLSEDLSPLQTVAIVDNIETQLDRKLVEYSAEAMW